MNKPFITNACAALLLTFTFVNQVKAQNRAFTGNDSAICAAVLPCNKDGSVQSAFNTGSCAAVYQRQCFSQKANELAGLVESCTIDSLQKELKYKRTIRSLKKQLRSARRR